MYLDPTQRALLEEQLVLLAEIRGCLSRMENNLKDNISKMVVTYNHMINTCSSMRKSVMVSNDEITEVEEIDFLVPTPNINNSIPNLQEIKHIQPVNEMITLPTPLSCDPNWVKPSGMLENSQLHRAFSSSCEDPLQLPCAGLIRVIMYSRGSVKMNPNVVTSNSLVILQGWPPPASILHSKFGLILQIIFDMVQHFSTMGDVIMMGWRLLLHNDCGLNSYEFASGDEVGNSDVITLSESNLDPGRIDISVTVSVQWFRGILVPNLGKQIVYTSSLFDEAVHLSLYDSHVSNDIIYLLNLGMELCDPGIDCLAPANIPGRGKCSYQKYCWVQLSQVSISKYLVSDIVVAELRCTDSSRGQVTKYSEVLHEMLPSIQSIGKETRHHFAWDSLLQSTGFVPSALELPQGYQYGLIGTRWSVGNGSTFYSLYKQLSMNYATRMFVFIYNFQVQLAKGVVLLLEHMTTMSKSLMIFVTHEDCQFSWKPAPCTQRVTECVHRVYDDSVWLIALVRIWSSLVHFPSQASQFHFWQKATEYKVMDRSVELSSKDDSHELQLLEVPSLHITFIVRLLTYQLTAVHVCHWDIRLRMYYMWYQVMVERFWFIAWVLEQLLWTITVGENLIFQFHCAFQKMNLAIAQAQAGKFREDVLLLPNQLLQWLILSTCTSPLPIITQWWHKVTLSRQIFNHISMGLHHAWVEVVSITSITKFSPYSSSLMCILVLGTIQFVVQDSTRYCFCQLACDGSSICVNPVEIYLRLSTYLSLWVLALGSVKSKLSLLIVNAAGMVIHNGFCGCTVWLLVQMLPSTSTHNTTDIICTHSLRLEVKTLSDNSQLLEFSEYKFSFRDFSPALVMCGIFMCHHNGCLFLTGDRLALEYLVELKRWEFKCRLTKHASSGCMFPYLNMKNDVTMGVLSLYKSEELCQHQIPKVPYVEAARIYTATWPKQVNDLASACLHLPGEVNLAPVQLLLQFIPFVPGVTMLSKVFHMVSGLFMGVHFFNSWPPTASVYGPYVFPQKKSVTAVRHRHSIVHCGVWKNVFPTKRYEPSRSVLSNFAAAMEFFVVSLAWQCLQTDIMGVVTKSIYVELSKLVGIEATVLNKLQYFSCQSCKFRHAYTFIGGKSKHSVNLEHYIDVTSMRQNDQQLYVSKVSQVDKQLHVSRCFLGTDQFGFLEFLSCLWLRLFQDWNWFELVLFSVRIIAKRKSCDRVPISSVSIEPQPKAWDVQLNSGIQFIALTSVRDGLIPLGSVANDLVNLSLLDSIQGNILVADVVCRVIALLELPVSFFCNPLQLNGHVHGITFYTFDPEKLPFVDIDVYGCSYVQSLQLVRLVTFSLDQGKLLFTLQQGRLNQFGTAVSHNVEVVWKNAGTIRSFLMSYYSLCWLLSMTIHAFTRLRISCTSTPTSLHASEIIFSFTRISTLLCTLQSAGILRSAAPTTCTTQFLLKWNEEIIPLTSWCERTSLYNAYSPKVTQAGYNHYLLAWPVSISQHPSYIHHEDMLYLIEEGLSQLLRPSALVS